MENAQYESLDNQQLISLLVEKEKVLQEQNRELEKLWHLLRQANRREFGKRSEKLSGEERQISLFSFELPETEPASAKIEVPAHSRTHKRGRKPLPKDIIRNRIEYPVKETNCQCCGKELTRISEQVTEELDYVPAHFIVNEHVRGNYACSHCKDKVETPELPPEAQPLPRARPGIGLLVYIILSKYVDHLPLYRLEQIFLRQGVELARQRMSDWLAAVVPKFDILYEALLKELLKKDYLQADETTIQVQDHEDGGKFFTGYFWGMHSPEYKLALFKFYETRASEAPKELFENFKGFIQTDAYAGYNQILLPGTVSRIACLAHIRRKFIDAKTHSPKECGKILEYIAELYKVEKLAKELSAQERQKLRLKKAVPVLNALHRYINEVHSRTLPKALMRESLDYALGQWPELLRYLEDGRFHIDNNAMEREIRPIALGRKNYLFAGSPDGAQRAAMLYSFIACCRLNNINVFAWFDDVLRRMVTNNYQGLASLLPHRWRLAENKI